MALYWCTEALPLAVTALLPIVLFPFLGILPSSKVCPQYFLDTNFLFLSGLLMASAIEEWNLHRRIALKVLMLVGVQPARLILGMMMVTAFLSMWLSNTASTAMMLPIANAILKSLFGEKDGEEDKGIKRNDDSSATLQEKGLHQVPTEMQLLTAYEENKDIPVKTDITIEMHPDMKEEKARQTRVWKAFLISIPYSASIGGTATLTGTAPNLILLGQLKSFFPGCDVVNFGSWFVFAFPLMILFLIFGWLWISIMHGAISFSCKRKKKSEFRADAEAKAKEIIKEDYLKLGPTVFAEKAVFFFFCLFAILLFTRDPKFIPGWASAFTPGFTSDAVTGITISIILFLFPSEKPSWRWWFDLKAPNNDNKPLLSWKKAQETVPWNIILLLGGGFAMAKGCEVSGLSTWIGGRLHPLEGLPPPLAVLLVTILIASFTEFASNTATIIVFLPVLSELAIRLKVNPLYLMIPGTVGCSYAFMLPVSTPPNSIAFATGHLLVKDMAKTGLLMNLMGVLLLSLAMNTWASSIFQLHTFPDWVTIQNVTSLVETAQNITTGG
ncbi:Na(+)/dicarboxylate cotransporter 3 [Bombina bombina]|uniref:Na(+)/dicarboxylate cotransporter 3 n=1 Tax=Bombina bombina TaxID=8345 RepID=UPI00235A74B7|nr:Na(+)/dicarboxylate cotransporter 3 [Bombina bombina]